VDGFIIHRAVVSEQTELEASQLRASLTNVGDHESLLSHPDAIELPLQQIAADGVFVSELNGKIVGFAARLPRPNGRAELDALFVDPRIRRCGIGRSLVEHCAQIARKQGYASLCSIGNHHAYEFYRVCVFDLTGKTETRLRIGLLMRKIL
jgi:GNAT superfamily N-acetyltransferase